MFSECFCFAVTTKIPNFAKYLQLHITSFGNNDCRKEMI